MSASLVRSLLLSLLAICLPMAASTQAHAAEQATVVVHEGFDYTDGAGADLLDGASGGTGWTSDWAWTYLAGSSLEVSSPGLTYPGLSASGNKASWYQRSGGNQISEASRSLTPSVTGVHYFQILTSGISNAGGSSGGGTPRIGFFEGGVAQAALGGNGVGDATKMSLLNGDLNSQLIVGSAALSSSSLLTILRIDHDAGVTSMWTNPDMSTFDYADPPAADGTTPMAFGIDRISILIRQGSVDEISVLRMSDSGGPVQSSDQRPPDWMKQYGRAQDEACATDWSPSWAEWPNDGLGGFTCVQIVPWSGT